MKVITVLGLKGGSTKSTLTLHPAVAAHHPGILTAIVDTDPQATLQLWASRRQVDGPPVRPETTPDFLAPTLDEFRKQGADLIILDTAARAEMMGNCAAELSDLVLIPCRTSLADMDAVPTSHAMCKSLERPHAIVFSDVDARGAKRDVRDAAAGMKARGIPTLKEVVCHRKGYKACLIDGSAIMEIEPEGKGAAEVDALLRAVMKQVGLRMPRKRKETVDG